MTCKQDLYFDTCAGVFFLWVWLSWVQGCFCKSTWRVSSMKITGHLLWLVMCSSSFLCSPHPPLFMSSLLLFRFLLLFNPASFTALTWSAFPLIPAEFAFLTSALVRFLAFLSVSLLDESRRNPFRLIKSKRGISGFYSLKSVVFRSSVIL